VIFSVSGDQLIDLKLVSGNLEDFQYIEGYMEMKFHIHVLSDAVLLEGVSMRVTSVSN
jgi:hypothetical protein